MARHVRYLAAILCAVGLVAGCGNSGSSNDAKENSTRTVATVKGDVKIPAAPKRVVLLNYNLAGYLYDLGLPVVSVVTEYTDRDVNTAKPYPAWADDFAKQGTKFMNWPAAGYNIEAVAAEKPDLIVGGGLGFPFKQGSDAYDKLSAIAPTILVDNKLESWQQQFEYLANAFDKPQVYTDAVKKYDARVAEVKGNITPPPGPVAYLSMTAQGKAYGLIENRGVPAEFAKVGIEAAPIFATGKFKPYTAGGDSFEITPEQLPTTVTQPSVFIIGFSGQTYTADSLRAQPVYASLPAFTANRAFDLPYWVQRPDFDKAIDTLGVVENLFKKK
ncbi:MULTISPECIES: Fe2+-enterobactin ABC transporter substrate-binding protein [Tsukamurella]|uniref:ABC transporter substrate-binding protein n=1 Tax=Tsukamurella strandjordii TaxID=147577 RepID=A0AA90SQW8_9ACTN|nr:MULTISPECIES: ABC transporter substrate-binding protein [Tsukamurella]MDP0398346.1 ABC transporter substrate-binding protein [Tsukamurella strandjordii]GIZ97800.1 iron-enterobactin transporter substrate-binding protein [Tsukamurella sp. TY48]